jgi:hypothetical protein
MTSQINWKGYWLSTAAVLIVARGLVSFIFFAIIFDFVYDKPLPGARPEGEELHAAESICMIAWSLAFTYIFTKGYQNKGWTEVIRFGLVVWVFYFVPMVTGVWAYFEVPTNWVLAGLTSGLAESLVAGLLVGLIYKPRVGR